MLKQLQLLFYHASQNRSSFENKIGWMDDIVHIDSSFNLSTTLGTSFSGWSS